MVKDWGVTQLVTAEREITAHDLLSMTAGMTNTWWHRIFEPSVYGVVPQLYKDAGIVDDLNAPAITLDSPSASRAGCELHLRTFLRNYRFPVVFTRAGTAWTQQA